MEKYKKRLQRLRKNTKNNNKNDETLNTKLTRMCDPPATRKDVVKMALFGEVLNEQLKENYTGLKTQREKDIFGRVVSGARIEKYKLCRTQDSAITYETLQKATNQSLLPTKRTLLALISSENMKTVQNFYENNENSRVGARKREFVTRNEVNKQKRYSLDTMGNLYKRFKSNKSVSGHGKSAADGVGATCKRSAYVIVATGGDIDSLESFIDSMYLKIHQIKGKISRCPLGSPQGAEKLIMKSLSCSCEEECHHFNLGVMNYQVQTKLHVEDIYSDSE
ncbi:hypothetical protein PV325_012060 [Microctonus aethiopoides]|nr:hypothetical protein PV325_012060 [Microctonus aethiopoides]